MLRLIRSELYRLAHKKSLYVYFGALAVAYLLVIYVRSGGFTAQSITDDAITFFNFLPALAGGFLFAALYTDDLNSKNLITLVGFGMSKAKIVTTKLVLMAVLSALVFALVPLFHCAAYSLLGWPATASDWLVVYAVSLKAFLTTLAFAAVAGIAVYGLQRTTFAMVLYILLSFGVISSLLMVALKSFAPSLADYLMSGISSRITAAVIGGGALTVPAVEYVIYVLLAAGLSIVVFYKKEMEF